VIGSAFYELEKARVKFSSRAVISGSLRKSWTVSSSDSYIATRGACSDGTR
jgi:hypothetical protein